MSKIPKPVSNRELAPEGVHNAVCIQVVDLGTQKTTFKGEEQERRQIQLAFQLVDEKTSTDDNFVVYQKYTYSTKSKNLLRDLKAWLGVKDLADFNMDDCLNKPVSITISHSDAGYANITNVSGLAKGVKVKKATEPVYSLYLTPEDFDAAIFNELPEWLQGKIADTPEYLEASKPKRKATPAKKGK